MGNLVAVSYTHLDVYKRQAYTTYGTSRANAYKILEDSLNLRDVRIYDTIEMCIRDSGHGGRLRHNRRYHQQWRKRTYGGRAGTAGPKRSAHFPDGSGCRCPSGGTGKEKSVMELSLIHI